MLALGLVADGRGQYEADCGQPGMYVAFVLLPPGQAHGSGPPCIVQLGQSTVALHGLACPKISLATAGWQSPYHPSCSTLLHPDSVWCAGVKPPTQASVPGLDRPKERSAAAVKPAARSSSQALEAATPSKRQRVVGAYQSTLLFPRGACLYCTCPDTCIVSVGLSLLDTPALLNRGFSLGS